MFYVLQEDDYDCGFAALKSLLATINRDANYLYLPNPKEGNEAYSFHDLMEYSKSLGFTLSAYRTTDKEQISLIDDEPMMVTTLIDEKVHMLVVYKISEKYVYFFDPAFGKKKMKKNEFIVPWDGRFLKIDDYSRKPCPKKKRNLLKKSEELSMDILEILACVFVTLGLCFIDTKYPFYLSIIMFACFALMEIALRSYCLRIYQRIDERTYNDSLKVKKGKMKDFYRTLEENKRYEVSLNLNSIYAVMSVVLVSLFIAVNGGYSLYYLFFGILFAFIEVIFLSPHLEKKNREILELEANIGDDDLALIKLAHEKAYRYGKITLLYRYAVFGMTLLGIVLIMALSGVVSVPYIIFYLCINVFFYRSLVTGLSMENQMRRHRQNVVHQINLLDK